MRAPAGRQASAVAVLRCAADRESPLNTRLIARGIVAGAIGGLVAFLFGWICGDAGGVAVAVVSFGAAMGALLAAAFAATYGRVYPVRPGAAALLLAGDAFTSLSLVPSIKYAPALSSEAIISQRNGLYLLMVGLSVALVIGTVTLGRLITRHLGTGNATFISASLYLAGIAAAKWLLPTVREVPAGFSGHAFMLRDLGTQLVLWATVAVLFARLAGHLLDAQALSAPRATSCRNASWQTKPR